MGLECSGCKAVGLACRPFSCSIGLCTQTSRWSQDYVRWAYLWSCASRGWKALGLDWKYYWSAHLKNSFLLKHTDLPCTLLKSFSRWSKTGGSFSDLESKRLSRNSLFSALGGECSANRSACSLYQAEWRMGGCLHKFNFNFENAAMCLHCWTGFFHQLKWYLHTYKVVISIYFILKVLGLILLLNWNAYLVLHSSTALIFFLTTCP